MSKNRAQKELEDFEAVFKALSHSSRRHILTVLLARNGQMTAGEIADRFSCSWPTTTRHLRVLQTAGLLNVEQNGREWTYKLNSVRLRSVVGTWLDFFETKQEGETHDKTRDRIRNLQT